jgi:hypothetical protein
MILNGLQNVSMSPIFLTITDSVRGASTISINLWLTSEPQTSMEWLQCTTMISMTCLMG